MVEQNLYKFLLEIFKFGLDKGSIPFLAFLDVMVELVYTVA